MPVSLLDKLEWEKGLIYG